MKKISGLLKGFTLIELLVVITIIGILATGGVAIFSSQIEKSRDSTRVTDLKAMEGALTQAYADMGYYPTASNTGMTAAACHGTDANNAGFACLSTLGFIQKLPQDPRSGFIGSGSYFDYTYAVGPRDGTPMQAYELSTLLENRTTGPAKAANTADGGNDSVRVEIGDTSIGIITRTNTNTAINATTLAAANTPSKAGTAVFAMENSCALPTGAVPTTGVNRQGSGTQGSAVIVIRGTCR